MLWIILIVVFGLVIIGAIIKIILAILKSASCGISKSIDTKNANRISDAIKANTINGNANQYQPSVKQTNNVDELLKYKQLYDEGAISKEEFEEIKNKLLV